MFCVVHSLRTGWMLSSLSSVLKMRRVSMPSTASMRKWHTTMATSKIFRSSSLGPRMRSAKATHVWSTTHGPGSWQATSRDARTMKLAPRTDLTSSESFRMVRNSKCNADQIRDRCFLLNFSRSSFRSSLFYCTLYKLYVIESLVLWIRRCSCSDCEGLSFHSFRGLTKYPSKIAYWEALPVQLQLYRAVFGACKRCLHSLWLKELTDVTEGYTMWQAQPLKRRDVVPLKCTQKELQVHLETQNKDFCWQPNLMWGERSYKYAWAPLRNWRC